MQAYDELMVENQRDELTERAARAFQQYLCRRYPGVVWVRVRENERVDGVSPEPLAGNLDLGIGGPHDVDAVGQVVAA